MNGNAFENIIKRSTRTQLTAMKLIKPEECVTSTKTVSQVALSTENLCSSNGRVTTRVEFIMCTVSHSVIPTGRLAVAKTYPKQGNEKHWAAALPKICDG